MEAARRPYLVLEGAARCPCPCLMTDLRVEDLVDGVEQFLRIIRLFEKCDRPDLPGTLTHPLFLACSNNDNRDVAPADGFETSGDGIANSQRHADIEQREADIDQDQVWPMVSG